MSIKNLVTFPMTSQWRHEVGYFVRIFNTFAENGPFACGFQLS